MKIKRLAPYQALGLRLAFLVMAIFVLFFSLSHSVSASTSDNIRGNAWNATYGFISMNCLDDVNGGAFPYTFPISFYMPPCSNLQHGVNLSSDNIFYGQAWNQGLGLISFISSSTPPDNRAFAVNCSKPSACTAGSSCIACYNEATRQVHGWMKIESLGDNGWVNLNSDINHRVSMSNYLDPEPGVFNGTASSTIGDILFNCSVNNSCSSIPDYTNWRTVLWQVTVSKMSAPNWGAADACSSIAKKAVFKWFLKAGQQTAYQIIINTTNSTSSPIFDTGKKTGSATQYSCPNAFDACALNYGTAYYWWVRLWDIYDNPTEWRQFYHPGSDLDILTDNSQENDNLSGNPDYTFMTYQHEFPSPFFSWTPENPLVGTTTDFTNQSKYYVSLWPNYNPQDCGSNCSYTWTTSDPGAIISDANKATTSIIFSQAAGATVSLLVSDPDKYQCTLASPVIDVNFDLPIWREIKVRPDAGEIQ